MDKPQGCNCGCIILIVAPAVNLLHPYACADTIAILAATLWKHKNQGCVKKIRRQDKQMLFKILFFC